MMHLSGRRMMRLSGYSCTVIRVLVVAAVVLAALSIIIDDHSEIPVRVEDAARQHNYHQEITVYSNTTRKRRCLSWSVRRFDAQ
jgi:hypothetical protein